MRYALLLFALIIRCTQSFVLPSTRSRRLCARTSTSVTMLFGDELETRRDKALKELEAAEAAAEEASKAQLEAAQEVETARKATEAAQAAA